MEWIDCSSLSHKELEEIRYQHEKTSGNRMLVMRKDGGTQALYTDSVGAPAKYLLTRVHPNASMIAKYAYAIRPVYLDGVETEDPMAAMDTLSSERLSFQPPKKTAKIKYRQYLWRPNGGHGIAQMTVNYGEAWLNVKDLQEERQFVRWIDDDWVTEEVEL